MKKYIKQLNYPTDFITIVVNIIDNCNYNCQYCYNGRVRTHIKIDLNLLSMLAQQIYALTHRKIAIELIGGEPTLHPKLVDFCKDTIGKEHIQSILIYTNFSQSIEYYQSLLSIGCILFVSWHGNVNDSEFIDKLMRIEAYKDHIYVSVMFEHNNIKRSIDVYDRIKDHFSLINMHLIDNSLCETYQTYDSKYLVEFNKRTNKDFKNTIIYSDGTTSFLTDTDFYMQDRRYSFKNWLCNAGKDYFYIHFDGSIYNCTNEFYDKKKPTMSLYCADILNKIEFKPHICRSNRCSCGQGIVKYNIFNVNLS